MERSEFIHLRKNVLKLNQSELGALLGVTYGQVSAYEVGKSRITQALMLAMLYLVDNKDNLISACRMEPEDLPGYDLPKRK